jgi:preprotein translocase subunit SecD
LFTFGTGPIKGFAVTLTLGIITSMFTAIIASRAIVNVVYGQRTISRLRI